MYIYEYDEKTKEYLGFMEADADPEETIIQNIFIPLVPANYTLIEPPDYDNYNQIPVYELENWNVKSDYRKNFYKVDYLLNVTDITTIGEQDGYIVVEKELGEKIKTQKDNYKVIDNKIIEKTPEEIEQDELLRKQEYILSLYMTRSDFFDGTIKAFGADKDDLLLVIEAILSQIEISDIDKKIALNNYNNAKDFYRKHPLFTMLSNIELPINDGVIITPEQWDNFFDETNKHNPDAYKELL